jgi:hypothetical protein
MKQVHSQRKDNLGASRVSRTRKRVVDINREMLAAIGEVVVDATQLECALAQLVTARWGWDGRHEKSMIARSGCVREQLTKLVEADPEWKAARELKRDAFAVLDSRSQLVHSVVVHAHDEDFNFHELQLWHAKSGSWAAMLSVRDVEELAVDIRSCFLAVVMTIPEADDRLKDLGATAAPKPPKVAL